MNIIKTLSEYVTEVFDKDKDGTVSVKEIMGVFPNYAVAVAFLVVDILVLVAEVRVWDVGMAITGNPYKAIGFVLVSGFPFYLAQILWLYPRANTIQLAIAALMGLSSLYTSAVFGLADLSQTYDINGIVDQVIYLTAGYIVTLLVYVVSDRGVKAWRMKIKARQGALEAHEMNEITRSVLTDLRKSMEEEAQLKRDFEPEAVQDQLDRLRSQKGKKTVSNSNQMSLRPAREFNSTAQSISKGKEDLPS